MPRLDNLRLNTLLNTHYSFQQLLSLVIRSKLSSVMSATLFSNVRIFDGVSVISENGHVLVESDRISQISLREPLSPPSDCAVVDASGCTLMPGLIDAHMHVFQDVHLLETALLYGVTTVLDLHNEPEWFRDIHAITKQRNDVSDVKSACFGATIKNGWPSAIVRLVSQEPNVGTFGSTFSKDQE